MDKQHILLVEDDINFGNLLRDTLTFNDYEVTLERDGVQGLRAFKQGTFDLCIFRHYDAQERRSDFGHRGKRNRQRSTADFPDC